MSSRKMTGACNLDRSATPLAGRFGRRSASGSDPCPATCSSWSRNCTRRRRDVSVPRELIDTGNDKRFVRRDSEGQFKESDDVGRSLAQDQKRQSSNKPKKGEGDKGD